MFKQIDCKNIQETSQRVAAQRAYGSTRDLQTLFAGNFNSRNPSSQHQLSARRSRRNKSMSFGINRQQPIGTRFSMSPMDELISVTRSRSQAGNASNKDNRHSKMGRKVCLYNSYLSFYFFYLTTLVSCSTTFCL
jgi:hypothetical protein